MCTIKAAHSVGLCDARTRARLGIAHRALHTLHTCGWPRTGVAVDGHYVAHASNRGPGSTSNKPYACAISRTPSCRLLRSWPPPSEALGRTSDLGASQGEDVSERRGSEKVAEGRPRNSCRLFVGYDQESTRYAQSQLDRGFSKITVGQRKPSRLGDRHDRRVGNQRVRGSKP